MQFVILTLISLLSTQLKTRNITNNENLDININHLVDHYIPIISNILAENGLDPLKLPQTEKRLWMDFKDILLQENFKNITTLKQQIKPMIYKANLILHSGILEHLSEFERYGNATLNYKDAVLKLNIGFKFPLLQGTYNYTVDMVFLNLKGRILASATNVHAKTVILLDKTSNTLSLDKFELEVPGRINIVIENKNGGVDWINTFIVNLAAPFFKNTIINVVQKEVMNTVKIYFDEVNNP